MKPYDYSLDAIKGISCILMIIAHIPLYFHGNERVFQIVAGVAPVLFFAVSGVTTTLQVKRRSFGSLLGFYVLFAVIGFAYNLMWRPDVQAFRIMDVPQIIALGVLSVYLLEKYLKPPLYLYLLLSLAVFAVHSFIGHRLPDFPLKSVVFTETVGFTYFPWLFAFLGGVFAYRASNRVNLIMTLVAGGMLVVVSYGGVSEADYVKYNMSMPYLLLSITVLFGAFYLFRRFKSYAPANPLLYAGKHSLLFLFTHLFLILAFDRLGLGRLYIVLIWGLVLICTYVGMHILLWFNRYIAQYLEHFLPWAVIVISVVAVPLVIPNRDLIILMEAALGMLFAMNYKQLSSLMSASVSPRREPALPEAVGERV
ncbi:hypothetical protein [Paenibacillus borealis]|uniref:Heparan-alpha-glucosaminide N-acetyltransferase catalytic domain-containing protein n=1 Tax=Paenibacillus borealis TaxID=160799 RepID=A0A089LMX1_PAEBO|nr:hypothetical protein [Paenibacillus borealis]AIQ60513.1 hypothetical protein PBOR_28880 [Paenibacillus borealis]